MMDLLPKFKLTKHLVLIVAFIILIGCISPPSPGTSPSDFVYVVNIQEKDTRQNIVGAKVSIQIGGKVPLYAITDNEGIATITISASFINQQARLVVEATNYQKYILNINLFEDALPTEILLKPVNSSTPTEEPTRTDEPTPTQEPTTELGVEPAIEASTPTVEPPVIPPPTTELVSYNYQVQVKAKDTKENIPEAIIKVEISGLLSLSGKTDAKGLAKISFDSTQQGQPAALLIEATGYKGYRQDIESLSLDVLPEVIQLEPETPPPSISGKIAIPLTLDGNFIVYIVDTSGNLLGRVDLARQPDFTKDGAKLIVNGDGGPWDKLRLITQIGDKQGQNIGDPGLGGHSHPFWSPDGTQLIYDDNTIAGSNWRMFIRRNLNETTGTGEELAAVVGPILGQSPLWTVGDWFIFRGCRTWANQGGDCGVWKMQGNLGDPTKLTDNVNYILTDVVGNIVVYNSDEAGGGNWNVYTLNINTKKTNQLTFDSTPESLATISPDGCWVAYLADQGGQLAVWQVSIGGGSPKKMFDIPKAWGSLTPDGWYNEKLSWGEN